jgi:hypothetical protein
MFAALLYVRPLETDFCSGGGMREVAIVDSNHHFIFLRSFLIPRIAMKISFF